MEGRSVVKGYKALHKDFTCRDGIQYEVGKEYTMPGKPECYKKGFLFCLEITDCFDCHTFNLEGIVAEVEAFGDIDYNSANSEASTNGIKIVRLLPWSEIFRLANTGNGCVGINNSGHWNSGCYNRGSNNCGNWNSGNKNTGNNNAGCGNSGNMNDGENNSGNNNCGSWNSGDNNSGDNNCGDHNSGNSNRGEYNRGYGNNGDWNYGNCNTGDYNSGDNNLGDGNGGNWNNGDNNRGCGNVGDWNHAEHAFGCFNTQNPMSYMYMFNQPSAWTYADWRNCAAREILESAPRTVNWVCAFDMTDEEKKSYPGYKKSGGYLKAADNKKAVTAWWNGLSENDKNIVESMPNFDWGIFCECVGIDEETGEP